MKKEAEMIIRGQVITLFSKLETSIILLTKVKNQTEEGEAAFEKYRMKD